MTLFGPAPRVKVKRGPARPSWTRVSAKRDRRQVGARCDPCQKRLHAEWRTGVPYVPARTPVWCRRLNDVTEYLCEECALPQIAADAAKYPRRSITK